MGAQSTREVLIVTKVVADKGNAETFKALAQQMRDAEKAQIASAKRTADAIVNESEKSAKKREKDAKKAADAAEREAKRETDAWLRGAKKTFDAQQKRIKDRERKETQAAKGIERAYTKAMAQADQMGAKSQAANMAIAEGFKMGIGGATALARSFTLLGVASEDDLEKAVKALAKVEAGVQAIRGVIDVVVGGVKMWRAYAEAVTAAAAAEAAIGTAKTIAASAGAAATAKGVASVAGNRVAGMAENVAAGAAGAGLAGAGGAKIAAGGVLAVKGGMLLSAVAAATGAVYEFYELFRDVGRYGLGGGATPGSLMEKIASAEVSVADWTAGLFGFDLTGSRATARAEKKRSQQQASLAQRDIVAQANYNAWQRQRAERDQFQPITTTKAEATALFRRSVSAADSDLTGARAGAEGIAARLNAGLLVGDREILLADAKHVEALKQVLDLRRQEIGRVRETAQAQSEMARSMSTSLREQRDTIRQNARMLWQQKLSAEERFGSLSASDQARAIMLRKSLDNPNQKMTAEQLNELRGYGVVDRDADQKITNRFRELAQNAGFDKVYNVKRTDAKYDRMQTAANALQLVIDKVDKYQIDVKMNEEAVVNAIVNKSAKLYEESMNRVLMKVSEMLQRKIDSTERQTFSYNATRSVIS